MIAAPGRSPKNGSARGGGSEGSGSREGRVYYHSRQVRGPSRRRRREGGHREGRAPEQPDGRHLVGGACGPPPGDAREAPGARPGAGDACRCPWPRGCHAPGSTRPPRGELARDRSCGTEMDGGLGHGGRLGLGGSKRHVEQPGSASAAAPREERPSMESSIAVRGAERRESERNAPAEDLDRHGTIEPPIVGSVDYATVLPLRAGRSKTYRSATMVPSNTGGSALATSRQANLELSVDPPRTIRSIQHTAAPPRAPSRPPARTPAMGTAGREVGGSAG